MQLNPRYGDDPVIRLEVPPSGIAAPTLRQRRRLADVLTAFTDEQWAHPSRCAGWSNREVIVHLDSTNTFWAFSITAGLRGEPTQFLSTFDPVASPAELVAASAGLSAGEVLDRFLASNEALTDVLIAIDDEQWTATAEAPPGHLSVSAVAHHALWDSWIHERDILEPLGMPTDTRDDEVLASLSYVAALAPALELTRGSDHRGVVALDITRPDHRIVVEIGDQVVVRDGAPGDAAEFRLSGDAVDLLEALSLRRPLGQPVPAAWSAVYEEMAESSATERW